MAVGVKSEIRRRVHLCRRMVTLQRALERCPSAHRVAGIRLLSRAVVVHQAVVLFGCPLAAPDSPSDKGKSRQDDGTAHTHDHADHRVASLGGHARG